MIGRPSGAQIFVGEYLAGGEGPGPLHDTALFAIERPEQAGHRKCAGHRPPKRKILRRAVLEKRLRRNTITGG